MEYTIPSSSTQEEASPKAGGQRKEAGSSRCRKESLMPNALICGVLIIVLAARVGFSQNIYGCFTGIVTDSSGSVVPSALVTARNTGTAAVFTSRSDGEGTFWIRNLPVGVYAITGELTGFQKFEVPRGRVQVDEVVRVVIKLSVGAAAEQVTVAGVGSVLDTTTATLKAAVDKPRVKALPLNRTTT